MKETSADTSFSIVIDGDWVTLKHELDAAFPLSRWQRIRRWFREKATS